MYIPNKLSVLALAIATLSGCGGDSASTEKGAPSPISFKANNGFAQLSPGEVGVVNLLPVIKSSNSEVELGNVELLEGGAKCGEPSYRSDELSFNAKIEGSAICQYQYTVFSTSKASTAAEEPEESVQSAVMTVVGSTAVNAQLPPISYVIELNGGTPTVNIKIDDKLSDVGSIYPAGFILSTEHLLTGSGTVVVDSANRTLQYTGLNAGQHQIQYKLEDPVGTDHQFGIIDLVVTDGVSMGVEADDSGIFPSSVNIGQVIDVNVGAYVTAPAGVDYQLTYVHSMTATVASKDPYDMSNKVFTFDAPVSGDHFVSYVVTSGTGSDPGMLKVTVLDPNQAAQWQDIQSGLDLYSAPLTLSEAVAAGAGASSNYYDGGYTPSINMATFKFSEAQAYCASQGRLPTSSELVALHGSQTPAVTHDWPVGLAYWADDSGTPALVNLQTGGVQTPGVQGQYVTCIQSGGLSINALKSNAVADGVDKAEVEVTYLVAGSPKSGEVVTANITSGNATLDSASETTDANGKVVFRMTNFTAQAVTVAADVNGVSVSQAVSFVGDNKTASVQSLAVVSDNAKADNVEVNQVRATLKDQNNNPLVGKQVTFSQNGSASLVESPASLTTDLSGQVTASFKNGTSQAVTITASYTNGLGSTTQQSAGVNFAPNCSGLACATIDLLDVGGGKLFTNSPSVAYLDSIGGSPNQGYLTSDGTNSTAPYGPAGDFYKFYWPDADALCSTYNTRSVGGRTNWRLPTMDELKVELYDRFGEMSTARGWPSFIYWSATPDGSAYYTVNLINGQVFSFFNTVGYYASCVSNP